MRLRRGMRRNSSMCGDATLMSNRRTCCLAQSGAMPRRPTQWMAEFDLARPIVAACKAGHEMSQSTVAQLRADGIDARVLEGGYEGWTKAGLPFVAKAELDRIVPKRPSIWVTRRRPKIDRIACPWLVRRFLDPQARILFVDPDQVVNVARESGGVPFDIKDVELSHVGERCSFDTMLKLFGLESEPSLARLALDRARRRYRPARYRGGSGRAACDIAWPVCARRRRRSWTARTADSWSTMLCSPGCVLPPRNDITGRPKPREQAWQILKRLPGRASAKLSWSGSRSAASISAGRPGRSR